MSESTQKKPLERLMERLEGVRDDLRVRMHLAGLEAKDAWDRAHLERVTDEIAKIGEEARVQAHLANLDAKEAWKRIEERLFELRGKVGASADGALEQLGKSVGELAGTLRGNRGERRERPERT